MRIKQDIYISNQTNQYALSNRVTVASERWPDDTMRLIFDSYIVHFYNQDTGQCGKFITPNNCIAEYENRILSGNYTRLNKTNPVIDLLIDEDTFDA